MADATDQVLQALAECELASAAKETVLELLRDEHGPEAFPNPELGPIYLTRVEVEGFRGIGPRASLELTPGKGLTLVVGPNGSGKSSFAEALERTLTGTTRRFDAATSDGQENWRNVHHQDTAFIGAYFQRERDAAPSALRVTWADGDGFREGRTSATGSDGSHAPAWLRGSWASQLALFPPLLPYTELAAVIDGKPSELFDQFDRLLGLGTLDHAANRAGATAKRSKGLLDDAKKLRTTAAELCAASSLEALTELAGKVKRRDVQPRAILDELTERFGTTGGEPDLSPYMTLTSIALEGVHRLMAERDVARGRVESLETTQVVHAERTAALLRQALELYQEEHAVPCPVCGVGQLDDSWRQQADKAIASHANDLALLDDARRVLRESTAEIAGLLDGVRNLRPSAKVASSSTLLTAADQLREAIRGGAPTAELEPRFTTLIDLIDTCRAEAIASHDAEAAAARPVLEAVTAWVAAADTAKGADDVQEANESARDWLRQQIQGLRDERLAGLGEQARSVWSDLRSTSAIELGPLVLSGSNTRRNLRLTCTTEGTDAMARSVLSQGELHAIALSLFIPRALHDESPFGFLVIDDPVQALDRLKVDGLADVLDRLAQSRQVVVFTHDDRLPDAVLRLGYDATILRVERAPGSTVSVEVAEDPASRALRDAATLANDEALEHDLASRAVAGCCRAAVEARAVRAFRLLAAKRGVSVAEIDATLTKAGTSLWNRVSLALEGEVTNDMRSRLEGRHQNREARLLAQLNSMGHDRQSERMADPIQLLEDTRLTLNTLFPTPT